MLIQAHDLPQRSPQPAVVPLLHSDNRAEPRDEKRGASTLNGLARPRLDPSMVHHVSLREYGVLGVRSMSSSRYTYPFFPFTDA